VRKNYGPLYAAPMAAWMILFFVIPTAIIFSYSFMTKDMHGGVIYEFTLSAYRALNNPTFFKVAFNTIWVAFAATILMVALAMPASYYMARSKHKNFFLLLIIIPFLTNSMIKIFAWMGVFWIDSGLLNSFLLWAGVIDHPIRFLYNTNAVIVVTAYTYLPFAILPLYTTIDKFDFSLLEAARDLGASKLTATLRILLPNIRGGITTAVLFTFTSAFGNLAIPSLIGGNDSYMLSNFIRHEFNIARNWPLVSSMSVILTIMTTIAVLIFMRLNRSPVEVARENREAVNKPAGSTARAAGTGGAV